LKNAEAGNKPGTARNWSPTLNRYRVPDHLRSLAEVLITVTPFALLWAAAWTSLQWSYLFSLAIAVVAASFLVRLFMIQRDCDHGSFFRRRSANDWLGRAISVITFTPYDSWRRGHAAHHASSGNLDRRGIGDITRLIVVEYLALPRWRRIAYRLYRHPGDVRPGPGLPVLGATQVSGPRHPDKLAIVAQTHGDQCGNRPASDCHYLVGRHQVIFACASANHPARRFDRGLVVLRPTPIRGVWAKSSAWTLHDAALHGSSHYDLPLVVRWFTANIGIHHVHHLCSRIPYYRLPRVLRDHSELKDVGRITLRESLGCVRLVLWDEMQRRMVSFRQLRLTQQEGSQG
jgi:acyl-lipid omega-6 desaturase (Delta-12 desaturase)